MTGSALEVVKWYTRARKFPQLIGRTPDGAKIPGGPYTFTQAVGAGTVLLVGVNTTSLWANYGLVGNTLLLLAAAYGVMLGLGRIPVGSRNPIAVTAGTLHALTAPRTGRLAGRAVRLRRPHLVRHRITVLLPAATEPPPPDRQLGAVSDAEPAAAPPAGLPAPPPVDATLTGRPQPVPAAAATAAARRRPALSGVQTLLAQTGPAPVPPARSGTAGGT